MERALTSEDASIFSPVSITTGVINTLWLDRNRLNFEITTINMHY